MSSSARSRRNEINDSAPGFNADIIHEHSSRVKSCCWQGKWFISLDQQSIQIWGRNHLEPDKIAIHQKQMFPDNRAHFISAVTHAAPLGPATPTILAACLDHTLKVYSEKLRLRSSIKWDAGTVTMMVYNTKNDTIITTGSAGVKLWTSTADTEAFAKEKALAASDRPWFDANGRIVPWCFGRFQTAKEQLAFQVPGLKTRITAADVAVPTAGNVSWCNMIQLLVRQQLLLAMYQGDVYGFDAADGTRLYSWRGLSQQPLVDMVYLTGHQQLVTASREPAVAVRQLQQDGSLAWVCSLGRFAAGVHCVAAAIGRPWLLTASLDGFVVAWSTETWQQLFRMKLPEAVTGLQFYKMDHFYCLSGNQVKFFKLRQAAECWMELNSPLMALEPLSYGLLLATFADSSIRLLDAGSTAADKSALTTVPQLSNASLLTAAADLPGGRLFALLSNGHVHVWDLHLTRPPALAEVWTHLDKDKCCSLVFMDGGSMDPAVAKNLGLSMKGQQITSTQPPSQHESTAEATTAAAAGARQLSADSPQHEATSDGPNGTVPEDESRPLSAQSGTAAAGGEKSSSSKSGSSSAAVEDHVLIGTRKGEVLVCDAARQGLVVLRIPAIKLLPVKVLLVDLDLNRLIVSGNNVVKIWDLTQLVCIAEFEAKSEFLCGHILEGRLLLGSASGRCYMLDLASGKPVTAPPVAAAVGRLGGAVTGAAAAAGAVGSSDHDGPVMCMSGSVYLQHYVTASQDGYVKVYDRDRRLKASLYLASPLLAAAFLNDEGDVLVASTGAKQLLVVRADTYAVTPRTKRDMKDTSIFDDLKGRANAMPRALLRNMTCKLQALATTPGPVPLARYPAPLSVGSSPSTPTATTKSKTPHGQSHLNPSIIPPWGLPTPSGVNPESSLQQPEVIQSSNRPPVDLDQNRLRADVARAAVPANKARRLSTLGRAVLSLQQQQQEEEREEEVGQQGVDGAHAAAGAVAATTAGGTASDVVGGSRLSRGVNGASGPQSLQQQQQQQPTGSLPQQRQSVILVAGLSVSTEQQQQHCVTAGDAAAAAVSPNLSSVFVEAPAATELHPAAATVQHAGLSAAPKAKGDASATSTTSSSTSGSRWNTTVEYNLKALQQHVHQGHNKQKGDTSSSDSDSASDDDSSNTGSSSSSSNGSESLERDYAVALAATTAAAAAGSTGSASSDMLRIGQLNIRLPNSTAGLSGALQSQQQQKPGLSASSSRKQREPKLQGLQPAMRRAVTVVENPDVFMEDVPVPADVQLLLDRYQAEMATKGKKKKNKKKTKKDAVTGEAEPKQSIKKKQKKTSAEGAAAGSRSSKPTRGKKGKQVTYTSALDYLMHTVNDPAVLVELKEAEAHESRQAALARQWLAVGASGTPRRAGIDTDAVGSTSRRGVPPIITSGGVQKLLASMKLTNRSAVEQQQQQAVDEDGLLRLETVTRAAP